MSIKELIVMATPSPLVKIFAAPYVAGDSIEKAISTAKSLWENKKLCSTIDLLGEEIDNDEDVKESIKVYENLIDTLGKQPYATISLKPSQLGSHRGTLHCQENIERLLVRAKKYNNMITIDMEDHNYTDMTLEMYRNLKKRYDNVGTVLQSRLFRTKDDILSLKGLNAHIRICIGIYKEPPEIALQDKTEMKKKLLEYVELLFKEGHYPAIGSHEEWVIREAIEIAERLNIPKTGYEVQMLMGVPRDKLQQELISNGITVRLYVPFATKWEYAIGYCKRRLIANPMMGVYVLKNLFKRN